MPDCEAELKLYEVEGSDPRAICISEFEPPEEPKADGPGPDQRVGRDEFGGCASTAGDEGEA